MKMETEAETEFTYEIAETVADGQEGKRTELLPTGGSTCLYEILTEAPPKLQGRGRHF